MKEPTLREFVNNLRGRSFKRYPDGRFIILEPNEKVMQVNLKDLV